MKRILFAAVALVLIASQALAVEPAVITFTAVTKYTDGTDIPAGTAISYNIYQGLQGQPKVKIANITTTGTTITTGLLPGSTYCFAATAVTAAGVEGAQSADTSTSCKLTPQLVPGSIVVTVK